MTEPSPDAMQWVSALSTRPSLEAAVQEVVAQTRSRLHRPADLGFVFVASAFASEYSRVLPLLREHLPGIPFVGGSGGGVIGESQAGRMREVEGEPALSLILASLPAVEVTPFHLSMADLPDLDSSPEAWAKAIGVPLAQPGIADPTVPHFILMADPFSTHMNDLLQGLDFAYPTSAKVGGLASSELGTTSVGLFGGDRFYRDGVVGVALRGNIVVDTIVAQGCRPIGQPYWVTEGERNILLGLQEDSQLGAVPASKGDCTRAQAPLEILRDLIQSLNDVDRQLAQNNQIFVGVAQNEFKQSLEYGDFLIRMLLGVDPRMGAIAIGDRIRPGQRIQFHLRDAATSAEDLQVMLKRYQLASQSNSSPIGALMFSCLGRGEALYGEPDFDSQLFQQHLPHTPLAGCFCNGEIGPVGNNTFLHGYTSVFGICRSKT